MKPTMQQIQDARFVLANKRVEERRRTAYREPAKVWELIDSLKELAGLREDQSDWARAEQLYREAIAHARNARHPRPEVTFELQSHLGYLYDRLSEPEKAVTAYRDALELAERNSVADPDGLGVVNNNLALLHKSRGEFTQAQHRYDHALHYLRATHGEQSPKVASVYNNLGVLHYEARDITRALQLHQRALAIRQQLNLNEHPLAARDLSQSFTNLSHVYRTMGDEGKADFYQKQAAEALAFLNAVPGGVPETLL